MTKSILIAYNFNNIPLQSVAFESLGSLPGTPNAGRQVFNSGTNLMQWYNGSAWIDPLARVNHSGTQLAATISNLSTTVQAYSLSTFAAPTANIPMAGFTLTGLNTSPNAAGQAAEYSWVVGQIQSATAGISSKPAVQAVATTNQTLSALPTIDGITLNAGQRLLLTNQTTASQNGPYVVAAGAWTRATTDSLDELDLGATWLTLQGTVYGGTLWRMTNSATVTLGTTAIAIVQFTSAGSTYTGSNAINVTGTVVSLTLQASSGLVQSGSGVAIDNTVVARKATGTITGDGSATTFAVTHALTAGVSVFVQVIEVTTGSSVETDINRTSTTNVNIVFAVAPIVSKQYTVVLIG